MKIVVDVYLNFWVQRYGDFVGSKSNGFRLLLFVPIIDYRMKSLAFLTRQVVRVHTFVIGILLFNMFEDEMQADGRDVCAVYAFLVHPADEDGDKVAVEAAAVPTLPDDCLRGDEVVGEDGVPELGDDGLIAWRDEVVDLTDIRHHLVEKVGGVLGCIVCRRKDEETAFACGTTEV